MRIEFKQNKCSICFVPVNRTVQMTLLKFTIYNEEMGLLQTMSDNRKSTGKRDVGLGWHNAYSPGDVGDIDWRIMGEVGYEGSPESEPTQCQCDSIQTSNVMTLAQNMLTLLDDASVSNVTLLVGGETFKAHKGPLTARSAYFRSLFNSGMTESLTNEVELDEDPLMFKEALKFMYTGLTPVNLDDVAIRLLPLADKYLLGELKQLCDTAIRRILSAENVAEVLRVADAHDCPDLFKYCVPFFKANIKGLESASLDMLFGNLSQSLFKKLLRACSD